MDRRNFLKVTGIGLTGLITGCLPEYKRKEIFEEMKDYVVLATTNLKLETEDKKIIDKVIRAYGVIKDNQYLTCAHCAGMKYLTSNTPFGRFSLPVNTLESITKIGDDEIENIVLDYDRDVAVFNMPYDCSNKEIPYDKRNPIIGEDIFIIGNPALEGFNIRAGNVSDIDGFEGEPHFFGHNVPLIGGDSGTPIVSRDNCLLGLNSRVYFGLLSYGIKIKEFEQ